MASRMIALFTLIVVLLSVTNTAHASGSTPGAYFSAESSYVSSSNGLWYTIGTVTLGDGTTVKIQLENINAINMVNMPVNLNAVEMLCYFDDGSMDAAPYTILNQTYTVALPMIQN